MQLASERPVALLLGGSSGIGLAAAQRLTGPDRPAPYALALGARDRTGLAKAALALDEQPLLLQVDVRDAASVQAAVDAVLREHGRLDAVVLSAQTMAYGTVEQVPAEIFENIVETAMHGTANVARVVLPVFRRQQRGTLVVVNSLLGEIAVPSMSSYVAAKWGQLGLVRSLQLEVRDDPGLHVCLVSPGAINTPIYVQAGSYAGRAGAAPPPVIAPDRVAKAIVSCLERPRRHVEVGPANTMAVLGFRLAPFLYDRLAGPLVRHVVLRGPRTRPEAGNVLRPRPELEAVHGGWTLGGRLRDARGKAKWRWSRPGPTGVGDARPGAGESA